jgi:hypothetical protein
MPDNTNMINICEGHSRGEEKPVFFFFLKSTATRINISEEHPGVVLFPTNKKISARGA